MVSVAANPTAFMGQSVSVTINYDVSDNNPNLTGLGLWIHFDSSVLTFVDFSDVLMLDNISFGGSYDDFENSDNDPKTDRYLSVNWASIGGNWPGVLPSSLMTINFDVAQELNIETTNIRFSSTSNTAGYEFQSASYSMNIVSDTWDFDDNGHTDALTDGMLMLRYAFGLRGTSMVAGVVAVDSHMSHSDIQEKLESSHHYIDIDGDGEMNALTDGLLLLRYLFGFSGSDITDDVIGVNASRNHDQIIEHLERHMPSVE